ncbi:MAG: hypothetical protein ACTMIA_10435 [Vibrio sp.]
MVLDRIFIHELTKALAISTPESVPRYGEEGQQVNCYHVYVTDNDGTYLAESVVDNGTKLKVRVWNEEKRTHEGSQQYELYYSPLSRLGDTHLSVGV